MADVKDTKEMKKNVTNVNDFGNPKPGCVRLVTSMLKGAGIHRKMVYFKTDITINDEKTGKNNTEIINRYYRKWEAKKKGYAINNIEKIIAGSDFKVPTFTDDMLKNGKESQ